MRFSLAALLLCSVAVPAQTAPPQKKLGFRHAPLLTIGGLRFKDLNRNGKLDPYEDWRLTPEVRTRDLISRMAVEDLAGLMVHGTLPAPGDPIGRGTVYDFAAVTTIVKSKRVSSAITRLNAEPAAFAEANNRVQEIAEAASFGVPMTISTDPRSHFLYTPGASVSDTAFSKWPETIGLAAIGKPELVRTFADIVRREYRAVGIREALSPQADLATEPRWSRMTGTFGEDAAVAKAMVEAYVSGMQNGPDGLTGGSVATVVKHWAGYGAQKDGFDSHNAYGRFAVFPGNNFNYHLIPFTGAFQAHVASVMPTYSILQGVMLDGRPLEPVGAGYSKQLLTGLLRGKYGFQGVILSDWAITNDCDAICQNGAPAGEKASFMHIGMPWGAESLTKEQRFAKVINAGVDQIGGTDESELVLQALHDGLLTRARMEEAAGRVLLQKFQMGLFEDPFVDPAQASTVLGNAEFRHEGEQGQQRSLVLLQNKNNLLPYRVQGKKIFLVGIDPAIAANFDFTVVDSTAKADLIVIRADTPFETLHPGYAFGSFQHEGRLDFRPGDPAYDALQAAPAGVPVVFTVYLDRPAILTNVRDKATAILGNFGIGDRALFGVLTGQAAPEGHLPFELPSSTEEVVRQKSDVPHDTNHPLYPYGFGLSYAIPGHP